MNQKSGTHKLSFSTKVFYGMSELGLMLIAQTFSILLMYFMTDFIGITAASAATLFLTARIWDAINDPMMGVLAEHTNMKSGKYRPYLLLGGIPLAISMVLNFTITGLTGTKALIWCYVTYIFFGMAYTATFIPYTTMISSLSDSPDDWTSLSSTKAFFNSLATVIVTGLTIPLITMFGKGSVNAHGYQMTAIVYAVVMSLVFLTTFLKVKERRELQKPFVEKFSFKLMAKVVFTNKPLLLIILFYFLSYLRVFLANTAAPYFFTYVYGNIKMYSIFGIFGAVFTITLCIISPKLAQKYGKIRYLVTASVLATIGCLLMFIFRNGPLYAFLLSTILYSFSVAPIALFWSLVADVVQYTEKKTGIKYDGLIYASASFVNKFSAAIAGVVAGGALTYFGYVANAEQTPAALFGINLIMFLIPAACILFGAVPLLFFKVKPTKENSEAVGYR